MEVSIKDLSKKYEGNNSFTLKDLNLEIDNKDFCVLLGPSGCGKTTLLRMIAGLNSITSGDLLFDGNRVNELSPRDRGIAMVFQSYALYPHMNVYNNIAFGLKIAKEKRSIIDRRVKDVAKVLNIYDYLYKKPSELSGGQRQRVALGRAIARKPKIFLMDEPLSNLDAKLREKMRNELVRIHNMLGTTSIYVTHDQLEAMTMATKIVLMNNQRIVQIGNPEQIYQKPNCIFAAKFIGTPTINIYKGKIINGRFISNDKLLKLKISPKHLELVTKYNLVNVSLGIRGDQIMMAKKPTKGFEIFSKSKIAIFENLGAESQYIFDLSHRSTIVVLSKDKSKKVGDTVSLYVSNKYFHLFDEDSQQRITSSFENLREKWNTHQAFLKEQVNANKTTKKVMFSSTRKRMKKMFTKSKNNVPSQNEQDTKNTD